MSSSSSSSKKRQSSSDETMLPVSKKCRQECKFGVKCYRKNPTHFEEFSHQHLNDIIEKWVDENTLPPDIDPELKKAAGIVLDQLKIVRKMNRELASKGHPSEGTKADVHQVVQNEDSRKSAMAKAIKEATKHHGDIQAKLDAAAPYFFFLTAVSDSSQTHQEPLTITFTELLDNSIGELQSSLQINFMVELGWLLAQYFYTGNRFKPLTLLYGVEDDDLSDKKSLPNNLTAIKIKTPTAFGHHHTKMSILAYKDNSIRVVVSTANLVESDWENRTQGLWVSPKLPPLPHDADTSAGESPTHFKADLLHYLNAYGVPQLQEWIRRVQHADFSAVRVVLVASVPGTHYGPERSMWGHQRLRSILTNHVNDPQHSQCPWSTWPIIGQFSSIGTLGQTANSWVCGELKSSLSAPSKPLEAPLVKFIYPSLENVRGSHDGLLGGACLPYQKRVHEKQLWLTDFLHQWKSNSRFRTRAMPHIKSYTRVSPCHSYLSWFLLTSANLSKAAWGTETKTTLPGRGLRILSYEAGVLFLPKFLVEDSVFHLKDDSSRAKSVNLCGTGKCQEYAPFPLHYDLPLQPYKADDSPFFYDIFRDS